MSAWFTRRRRFARSLFSKWARFSRSQMLAVAGGLLVACAAGLTVWMLVEAGAAANSACLVATALGFALCKELRRRGAAESVARDSAAEQLLLTESAHDLILKLSWDGTRRFVSPACRRLLGREPAALLGRNWLEHVHVEDSGRLTAALERLEQGGTIGAVTYRKQRADGVWRWLEAQINPLPDGSGAVVVARDVTDRAELEAQLRQAQKMDMVGRLTAGVAHDFNNLLQAQMGSLQLLMDEIADRPLAMEYADVTLASVQRAARLTHELLAFSRKQHLRAVPVDLGDKLRGVIGMLRRTLGPGIAVKLDIDGTVPAVQADPAQLETALLHLALNARDAMPRGGVARIGVRLSAIADATGLDGVAPGDYVMLTMGDTGVGMDAETLAQACEPYFTTKGVMGSGLGLAMVQGFCRQSGGDFRIDSLPGAGTTAEMWLPVAQPVRAVAEPAAEPAPENIVPPSKGRVLLVDDETDVLVTARAFLLGAGYEVVHAGSGDRALVVLAANERFDVLVTDYAMPGLNGADLVQQAVMMQPGLGAIIITGFADLAGVRSLPNSVKVLRKPFLREAFLDAIGQLIASPPLARQSLGTG